MDYRKKISNSVIKFPQGFVEESRGLNECCCFLLAIADDTDTAGWKNDIAGVWERKGVATDSISFTIEKCGTSGVLLQLGTTPTFPQDDLLVGYMYDWREYLINYGPGEYTIKVVFTIAGVSSSYTWAKYQLLPYSLENTKRQVRLHSQFRSMYKKVGADFSGSNFESTVRFQGYFGDRDPATEIKNLVDKGFKVIKTTREDLNKYTLTATLIKECTSRFVDFHLLNEDECLVTDYNALNYSYQFRDFPVVVEEPAEYDYKRGTRYATLTVVFGNRDKKDKSYYNLQ